MVLPDNTRREHDLSLGSKLTKALRGVEIRPDSFLRVVDARPGRTSFSRSGASYLYRNVGLRRSMNDARFSAASSVAWAIGTARDS